MSISNHVQNNCAVNYDFPLTSYADVVMEIECDFTKAACGSYQWHPLTKVLEDEI